MLLELAIRLRRYRAGQALARNPAIKLYGLQWSAPAWVRDSRAYQYGPAGLASLGYYPVRYASLTVR